MNKNGLSSRIEYLVDVIECDVDVIFVEALVLTKVKREHRHVFQDKHWIQN